MKIQLDSIKNALELVKTLRSKLPENSPIANKLENDTVQWLITLKCAIDHFDKDLRNEEDYGQIESFLFSSDFRDAISIAEEIGESEESGEVPAESLSGMTLSSTASEQTTIENNLWKALVDNPSLDLPNDPKSQQIELCRWYSWRLALSNNNNELKYFEGLWQEAGKAPSTQSPQLDDVIIYAGQKKWANEKYSWVCDADVFPLFSEYCQTKTNAKIWLSFDETDGTREITGDENDLQWFKEHLDTLSLWHRWYDLLYWTILAPEAYTFVGNQEGKLSQERQTICKTLNRIGNNLKGYLKNPEEYVYIAQNLHRLYSAFHQFLLPTDFEAQSSVIHPFAILRRLAKDNLEKWLKYLEVDELRKAGVQRKISFIGDIHSDREKSFPISNQHPLLNNVEHLYQESKVLYWLCPKWQQNNPPANERPELLGRVLFCSSD